MSPRTALPLPLACCAIALAACTSITGLDGSSNYSCKAPEGVTCDSVSGVYANAVANNLPSHRRGTQKAADSGSGAAPPAHAPRVLTTGAPPTSATLRSSPRILRLWFKPWEDADHDLYDQGFVYVQVDPGQWQIDHVQRQIRDTYAPIKPPPRPAAASPKDGRGGPADAPPASRPPIGGAVLSPPATRQADSDQ